MNRKILKGYIFFKVRMNSAKGQAMAEYGLIIALIAVVLIVVIGALTGALGDVFKKITDALKNAVNPPAVPG